MSKKIYISTPVTSRPEPTLREKFDAAQSRVTVLKDYIKARSDLQDYNPVSTFDINEFGEDEAVAMGRCVQAVIECDAFLFDDFAMTCNSRGCRTEKATATIYSKGIYHTHL